MHENDWFHLGFTVKTLLSKARSTRRQVMEVQGNLSKTERSQALHSLATPGLKKTAKATKWVAEWLRFGRFWWVNPPRNTSSTWHPEPLCCLDLA